MLKILKKIGLEHNMVVAEPLKKNNTLLENILKDLKIPFHEILLSVHDLSILITNKKENITALVMSEEEGGFAKKGLIIKEPQKDEKEIYKELNYIELCINEENYSKASMSIFSHELGHVIMNNLMPSINKKFKSNKIHCSMGITDYFTAFSEGWAEHFERLAYENVSMYKETYDDGYSYDKIKLLHSQIDSNLRIDGIPKNSFANKSIVPEFEEEQSLEDKIQLAYKSPIFNPYKVKRSQELLSCEGALSTIFYRITINETLRNNVIANESQKNILSKSSRVNIADSMSHNDGLKNVLIKYILVFNELDKKVGSTSNILVEFISSWCELFPNDEEELIKLFVLTTYGVTVSNKLSREYELMAKYGLYEKYEEFLCCHKKYSVAFKDILNEYSKNKLCLFKNVIPEIWLKVNNNQNMGNNDNSEKEMIEININTINEYELMKYFSLKSLNDAKKIITERENICSFRNIEKFYEILKKYSDR